MFTYIIPTISLNTKEGKLNPEISNKINQILLVISGSNFNDLDLKEVNLRSNALISTLSNTTTLGEELNTLNYFIDGLIYFFISKYSYYSLREEIFKEIINLAEEFDGASKESGHKITRGNEYLNYNLPSMEKVKYLTDQVKRNIQSDSEQVLQLNETTVKLEELRVNTKENNTYSIGSYDKMFFDSPLFNSINYLLNQSNLNLVNKEFSIERTILDYSENFFSYTFDSNVAVRNEILKQSHTFLTEELQVIADRYYNNQFSKLKLELASKQLGSLVALIIIFFTPEKIASLAFGLLIKIISRDRKKERINATNASVILGESIKKKILKTELILDKDKTNYYDKLQSNKLLISHRHAQLLEFFPKDYILSLINKMNELEVHALGYTIINLLVKRNKLFDIKMETVNNISTLYLNINQDIYHKYALKGLTINTYPMITQPNSPNYKDKSYLPFILPETSYLVNPSNNVVRSKFSQLTLTKSEDVLFPTINYLNSVRFKINNVILDLFLSEWFKNDSIIFNGLNHFIKVDEPHLLSKEEIMSHNSKHSNLMNILSLASLYRNYSFFLPSFADFRGRFYTFSNYLTYQNTDLARALFLFDTDEVLTKKGLDCLYLYFASLGGESKSSENDKIKWSKEHASEYYLKYQLDPDQFFKDVTSKLKEPFQFMSILFALNSAIEGKLKGEEVIINNPILFDASCNGLQHLSAMTFETALARETNLIGSRDPSQRPNDFYQKMSNSFQEVLNDSSNEKFKEIQSNRKLVKHSVMTITYNVSQKGVVDQIKDQFKKRKFDKNPQTNTEEIEQEWRWILPAEFSKNEKEVIYDWIDMDNLGKLLYKTIIDNIPTLKTLRGYLNKWTRILILCDEDFNWVTPAGLEIYTMSREFEAKKTRTSLLPNSKFVTLQLPTNKIDSYRSKLSFIANMIHSLDANNIVFLIKLIEKSGIPLYTVHDCFASTPNNMEYLDLNVKKAFINIYLQDESFLEMMHNNFVEQLKKKGRIIVTSRNVLKVRYLKVEKDKNGNIISKTWKTEYLPKIPKFNVNDEILSIFKNGIMESLYMIS